MKKFEDMKGMIVVNPRKSMKGWIWVIIIIIAVFLIVGFLHDQGYLNVKWQGLAMIFAVIAGPYKLLKNYIGGGSKKTKKMIEKHKQVAEEEKVHRKTYDADIAKKEDEIIKLEAEVEKLDKKIEDVRKEQQNIPKEVNNMSIDETQNEFLELYGSSEDAVG